MLHPAGQLGQVSSQMIISKSRQRSPEKGGESQRHEPSPLSTGFPYYEEKAYDAGFKLELHCHFSPLLNLIVDTGSVFEKAKQVDAVVCSDKKDGRGKGYIAKTLLEKGGHKYKMAAERAFKQNVKFGDVVVVKEEALGFKKVLIAIMWQKDPTDTEFQRVDKFRSVFKAVFQKAVSENCKSIVMPLMFTGEGKVKPSFCAERLLESCLEFSKEAKRKLTVYLINHEKWKTDTIMQMTKDYIDLQKTIYLSSRDQTVSQKPDSYKPTGRPDPKKGENLRSRQDVSRSQSSNQRPRGGGETNSNHGAMSSSFTSRGSRGSGSGSKFHDGGSESMRTSDRSWEHSSKTDKEPAAARDKQEENCVICMDTVNKPKKLKCGHVFCTDCIDSYFSSCKKVCPTCGVVCGVIKGDQPPGRMEVRFDRNFHCAGFEGVGTHVITYSFDPGKQGADHPNPGRPYKGITRTAFLPDTREGREVLKMLEVAFDRKLVFTIGSSRTTGQEGVITWNDIHHKTNPKPNTPFGYPDDGYLDRVKDELAVKGVTPEDIPASQRSK